MLSEALTVETGGARLDTSKIPSPLQESLAKTLFDGINKAHENPVYEADFQKWLCETRGPEALKQYLAAKEARLEAIRRERETAKQHRRDELLKQLAELEE